jgi:[histone H3]-lysine27 N-trimethyltransferase EZH2
MTIIEISTNHMQMWPQHEACACPGPCRDSCPCRGDANFCEKYCACDPDRCGNRHAGCTCKCGLVPGRRCSSRSCPCMAAGRECDPDVCRDCRPTLNGSHREGWACNNFRVRLGQKKRVLMGLSGVQGWGAFVWEGAQKDEFVVSVCGRVTWSTFFLLAVLSPFKTKTRYVLGTRID